MTRYIARRIIQTIPLLLLISMIGFAIIQATGDPLSAYTMEAALSKDDIARLRAYYGLDQPVHVQYLSWLQNLAKGDWGTSYIARQPVAKLIMQRLPNTLILVAAAYAIILTVSVVLGIYTAVRQYSLVDHVVTGLAFVGIAVPSFWLGLVLLILFAVEARNLGLPYFPAGGYADRARPAPLPLGLDRHRGDVRLAGHGPLVLGACRADRHPGPDGDHALHGVPGRRLQPTGRRRLRLPGSTDPLWLSR